MTTQQVMNEPVLTDHGLFNDMMAEVAAWCHLKGWEPDPDRTFGDEIALLHSEASEALEAYRDWKFGRMETGYADCSQTQEAPATYSVIGDYTPGMKPEGVPSEFADILIRLLHYSFTHGIDLFAEYRSKMSYNQTRAWRHGGRNM